MEKSTSMTKPLLNSSYNVINQLEKKADFLYSVAERYVQDAEKDNRPELVKVWNSIKEDEARHLDMLKEALLKEVKQDKL